MWLDKIKEALFHRVVGRAIAAGIAAGVAYLSRPEIVGALMDAGITIDPSKLAAVTTATLTGFIALAYHFLEHKIRHSSD